MKHLLIICSTLALCAGCGGNGGKTPGFGEPLPPETEQGTRDPQLQPFSSRSIWNMPIGSGARYVPAGLVVPTRGMVTVDENLIVMTPDEPLMDLYYNGAFWDKSKNRCTRDGDLIARLPIPQSFIVSPETWDGVTPNASLAVLMPDKRYIYQGQPFAHCMKENPGLLGHASNFDPGHPEGLTDLYGDGIYGAHGGSRLSAIGGALRVHELTPTSGPIRHALKVNLCGKVNYYYDKATQKGFRWPAVAHDSYAAGENGYGSARPASAPVVKECQLGALLALKPDFDTSKLKTEPARIIAQALIDYGAYVVDDTGWDVFAFTCEWGPAGRFTEEFRKNWGWEFIDYSKGDDETGWSDWARDIRTIFTNLQIVVNNADTARGGGGEPRVPLAPALKRIK